MRGRIGFLSTYVRILDCMKSTQRCEAVHSYFDGFLNAKITLKIFIEQYDVALRDKYEKELREENKYTKTIC